MRNKSWTRVDFPAPDGPTIPSIVPESIRNEMSHNTGWSVYPKVTLRNSSESQWLNALPEGSTDGDVVLILALEELFDIGSADDDPLIRGLHGLAVVQGAQHDEDYCAESAHIADVGALNQAQYTDDQK